MTPSELRWNGTVIHFDASVVPDIDPGLFDVDWLKSNALWQGSTQGRSQAHFFHYAGIDMVLRHFHRGGMMGRVNRDLYLRTGAHRSRAFREFDLLRDMHADGLPVPLPVAAQYAPAGPVYRADIITQRIPDARPLDEVLRESPLPPDRWSDIGAQVRTLHDHGIYHSDLNCRNILMDAQNKVWFIDFDNCAQRAPGAWTQANLDRLLRSLRKVARGSEDMHWREQDWADLLAGYNGNARGQD